MYNCPLFYGLTRTSIDALRTENDELHRLVEEMKLVFAQAAEQEAEKRRIIRSPVGPRSPSSTRPRGKRKPSSRSSPGQIHELETHIQQAPPPPPTEDELSKMADELKKGAQLSQDRKTMDAERQQFATTKKT